MKRFVLLTFLFIAVLVCYQLSAFALDPVSSLVARYRNLYVNKATKQTNLNWAPKKDPGAADNYKFCKSVSQYPAVRANLTCLTPRYYSLRSPDGKYELIYSFSGDLLFVVFCSSKTTPAVYYTYLYPAGTIRGVYIKHSQNDRLVYKPDGKLDIYLTRNGCFSDNKENKVGKLQYTQQLCESYYLQEVGAIGYPQSKF